MYLFKPASWLVVFILAAVPLAAAGEPEAHLERRAAAANVAIYQLAGEQWITIPDLSFLLGGSLVQEELSRRTEISFAGNRVVFLPHSQKVLYNQVVTEMSRPTRFINGVEAVTVTFASLLLQPAFIPSPPEPFAVHPPAAFPAMPQKELMEFPSLMDILSRPKKQERVVLVLDPGHGGKDPGAIGPRGLAEKTVVLDLALRIEDYLKKRSDPPELELILTRRGDYCVSLEDRVRIANEREADLFVSIHANDARLNRYTASGFETFYPSVKPTVRQPISLASRDEITTLINPEYTARDIVQHSRYLAGLIQERLSDTFVEDIPDRGVKRGRFYVLRETWMASVLVEVGFISNPNIELNLRSPQVRQAIAVAIARGIEAYLEGQPLRPKEEAADLSPEEPVLLTEPVYD